jgi:uncharacterized protein YndB with AHSA1/START domain
MTDTISKPRYELSITRIFDAPRELVFAVWVQPDHIPHWWGPRGYATLSCAVDLRPSGAWRIASRHEDGHETAETGVIREVDAPARLVLTHAWEDAQGKPGAETVVTVTFAEEGGKTRMTFHQASFTAADTRDGHETGWNESFDMLAEYLARG